MKLKTKFQDEDFDFGEVVEANICYGGSGRIKLITEATKGGIVTFYFKSLKELNEMFEDYEEPKEHWYIEPNGVIARIDEWDCCTDSDIEIIKTLGNYFETKEEAEKAVEKLKAWKRLEDKGFRFDGYSPDFEGFWVIYPNDTEGTWCLAEDKADLNLLFGGER